MSFSLQVTVVAKAFHLSCGQSLLNHTISYTSSVHIRLQILWYAQQLTIISEMYNKTRYC